MANQDFKQPGTQDSSLQAILASLFDAPAVVLKKEESSWSQAWHDFKRASEAAKEEEPKPKK